MSNKGPIKVDSAVVAEGAARGSKILTLSTRSGEFEFECSQKLWDELAETARWFFNDNNSRRQ